MKQSGVQVDERSASIFRRVCTRMYLATIVVLWLDVLYRQLWLHQPVTDFMDLALIVIANVVLPIGAILYFGGVTIPRFRASLVAFFYVVCVVAGTAFRMLKDPSAPRGATLGKLLIVASVSAILILLYLLAAYAGTRKLDKEIED
ncbi:MAG: hypothetical protein LAP85_14045 [Acidobacteriia bacterium]|nr:hypothetical protein [Terriglobia bacterium]